MTDYNATPEQWADAEEWAAVGGVAGSCLLELRARVEALEANSKPTSNLSQIRSSLVERVAETLHAVTGAEPGEPPELWKPEARAAIREVAEWLHEEGFGGPWGRLEQEAER